MSPSGKSHSSESSSVAMKPSRLVAVKYCVFMAEAYTGRWVDGHAPRIGRRCVADREAAPFRPRARADGSSYAARHRSELWSPEKALLGGIRGPTACRWASDEQRSR